MKRSTAFWLTIVLVLVAIATATGMLGSVDEQPQGPSPSPVTTTVPTQPAHKALREDDPFWDCRTMGDRDCGPVIGPGLGHGGE